MKNQYCKSHCKLELIVLICEKIGIFLLLCFKFALQPEHNLTLSNSFVGF